MEVSEPERLIRAVQHYPILYNGTVLGNKELRLKRWKDVAAALNPTWDTQTELEKEKYIQKIQTRWRSLRDSFTRALRSIQLHDISGYHSKKKRFTYFEQLEFLKPYIQKSKYASDEFGESSTLSTDSKFESLESYQDMEVNLLDLKSERQTESSNDLMETQYSISEQHDIEGDLNESYTNEKIGQILEKLMYNQSQNHDHSVDKRGNKMFLLSLLPFMENLPDDVNMEVRMKIMGVIKPYLNTS